MSRGVTCRGLIAVIDMHPFKMEIRSRYTNLQDHFCSDVEMQFTLMWPNGTELDLHNAKRHPDHASLTASTASNEGVYIDSPQLASHSVLIFATLFLSYSKRRCTLFALDNLCLTLFANNTNLGAFRETRSVAQNVRAPPRYFGYYAMFRMNK